PNGRIQARVRLDPAKIAALAGVRTSLEACRTQVERLADRLRGSSMPYVDAKSEFEATAKAINGDIPAALKNVGPEFGYVGQRLVGLFYEVANPNAKQGVAGAENLIEQLDEDLESVNRW